MLQPHQMALIAWTSESCVGALRPSSEAAAGTARASTEVNGASVLEGASATATRSEAPMKMALTSTVLLVLLSLAYVVQTDASAGSTRGDVQEHAQAAGVAPSEDIAVGTRYLVPALPASVLDHLPAVVVAGDRYLPQRIALAELVVGDHILAAEDLATRDARDLPGFDEVLLADGFRSAPDGTWFYDRFSSWMRFPLNR